jgi:predicted PurR-regulated permease PerM
MEKIEISHRTVIFTVLFLISIWFIYQLRIVLVLWFISFLLMTALNPLVESLEKKRIPRLLSIITLFILGFTFISIVLAVTIPILIEQINVLTAFVAKQFPDFTIFRVDENVFISQIESLSRNAVNLLKIVSDTFSNVLAIFMVVVLTIYLLVERKNFDHYTKMLFNDGQKESRAKELITGIEHRLGGWIRGQLVIMFLVGLMCYIGLSLLGIPFALPLALLAGTLEVVPNLGPTLSLIPSVLVGFTISPVVALGIFILYIAVQQLENQILTPLVMRQSTGIKPIVTLMVLMVGITLGGIWGAILAIPAYIMIEVVFRHIFKYRHGKA